MTNPPAPENVAVEVSAWVRDQSTPTSHKDRTLLGGFEQVMRWRGVYAAIPARFEELYEEYANEKA